MNYHWKFRLEYEKGTDIEFAKRLKIPRSLAQVLISRNIKTSEDVEKFFKPSLSDLHDPFLMKDMDKVVDRLILAVQNKELIWVHGDYDVDGTASTAMVCQFITEIGGEIKYYIPDRFTEGYGLSEKSISLGLSHGAKVLLTVDVGITSYNPLDFARKYDDLDVIICDHHEPGDEVPEVFAVIDPLRPQDDYPFKGLAACGVAFKIIHAMSLKLNCEEKAMSYLDFVALASVADSVPLVDENRILVHHGLSLMNRNLRPGLKGLMYCTGLRGGSMTASNIVFSVAPLINAAGRLGDAKRSVEMMMQKNEIAAFRIAQELEEENRRRRIFDQQTFEEAIPMADELVKDPNCRVLVIHKDTWHAGVIGIVASRLVDRYNMPAVLMTTLEGIAKGSARSISTFDIHSALKKCSDLMIEFGGHRFAAGLSLDIANVPELRRRINDYAHEYLSLEMLKPEILIDAELKLNELSPMFFKTLDFFAPYGFHNIKPVFFSRNVQSVNGIKVFGNNNIRFRAKQNNFVIDAIGNNLAHKISLCTRNKKFKIVYNLEETAHLGARSPQLNIIDIQPEAIE